MPAALDPTEQETEAAILAYLHAHPEFFTRHPETLRLLVARSDTPTGVVDLQRVLLERLRDEVSRTETEVETLLRTTREALSVQSDIHDAVLQLLRCGNRTEQIATLTQSLPERLGADIIQLCVETDIAPTPDHPACYHFHYVPRGTVQRMLGRTPAHLGALPEGGNLLFPGAEGLVASCALLRLSLPEPHPIGLLALGTRVSSRFTGAQGSEAWRFLATTVGMLLARI